jgi:hypothetical protein
MYQSGSTATLKDVHGFLADAMKNEQVPEPLRKQAAALLLDTGWATVLGVEDLAIQLLGADASASKASNLYEESTDLMLDDRV